MDSGQVNFLNNGKYRGECAGIFTPHYLGKPLRDYLANQNRWLSDDELRPLLVKFQQLWQDNNRLGLQKAKETRTRREFIDRALDILGFSFLDEETFPQKGEGTPDYLLFCSDSDKKTAAENDESKFKLAIGIAEAKKWGLELGSRLKDEGNRFPHHQVADYLKAASYGTNKNYFNWAILTNATHWRLYTRQAKPFSYFEIDLEQAIASIDNFRYFYILFNASALIRDTSDKCLLDYLYTESLEKQEALEKDLRKRIFVLVKVLANGFYNYPTNEITSKDLDALYENCLIFLYRLLFVFYAEGLNLLPATSGFGIDSKHYRERYSLRRFRKLLDDKSWSVEEDQLEARMYNQIDELFDLINGHDEKKNRLCRVTRYNGGLFNPDNYPLLKKWKVGDYSLSEVLKGLIYIPLPSEAGATTAIQTGETIDYSSLEIRQLGSIYEGLLEQQLKLNKVNNELEWVEDKSERKSSGSYYTPDYIVKYIVNHTLQPLVDRIAQQANVKSGIENSFAKAVFDLHVLDPAMGSAHFLVRATEFLAEQIMYHPTTVQAVTKVPFGMKEEDAEKAYWLRRVVESCIYGVDLNPLAVELAKLSLWLTCISSDKPLNFLDHHLRCGNSLVGAKNEDLGILAQKGKTITVFERIQGLEDKLAQAHEAIHKITDRETDDINAIERKKYIWDKDVQNELAPFRAIADLRTSMDFGLELKADEYQEIVTDLLKAEADEKGLVYLSAAIAERYKDVLVKHAEIVERYSPFHWELEFPDVFVKIESNWGFDAVIGNPPYRMIQPHNTKLDLLYYIHEHYPSTEFKVDLFHLFIQRAVINLRVGGHHSYIIPTSILNNVYAENLRKWIMAHCAIQSISVARDKVFSSADVFNIVLHAKKEQVSELRNECKINLTTELDENFHKSLKYSGTIKQYHFQTLKGTIWNLLLNEVNISLIKNIEKRGQILSEYAKINRGLITGEKSTYFSEYKVDKDYVAIIAGSDVHRYFTKIPTQYVLFIKPKGAGGSWDSEMQLAPHKVVVRQIGFTPTASLLVNPIAVTGNIFTIRSNDLKTDYYLLGILNSRLIRYYWRIMFTDYKSSFPQVTVYSISNIPVIMSNKKSRLELVTLVQRMLDLNKQLHEATMDNVKDELKIQIEATDKEIDALVYELYGLTEEEIKIVEEG